MFTFAEKLKQMSNIEHKDVGVSSLKGTPSKKIYIKTSTEAVYNPEGVTQEYINNHVDGSKIVDGTITTSKIANNAVAMGKLDNEVQTLIQQGADSSWTPMGDYDVDALYYANDLVFDPETNSSYLSLRADNMGHAVTDETWWMKVLDGSYVNRAIEEMEAAIAQAIEDAQEDISGLISDSQATIDAAVSGANTAAQAANTAAAQAMSVVANKVADAQIGYFECNTLEDAPIKATTSDTIGTGTDASTFKVPATGASVKIKMEHANTADTGVKLQFGSNTATQKDLLYNGEAVSASNSWDEGEVISVYFDGTNYQASNAMGGGSAVGAKKLAWSNGYINTSNVSTKGAIPGVTTKASVPYVHIKYAVNEGDVFLFTGTGNGSTNVRVWATGDESNNFVSGEVGGVNANNTILVVPEGVKWVILNSQLNAAHECYYAKAGSVGAYEILTESYLYKDLRTLVVGQAYTASEAVKTKDKQFVRLTKDIKVLNLTDEVLADELKTITSGANLGTYKASQYIYDYTGNDSDYTDGDYAIGNFAEYSLTITAGTTAGNISVNGTAIEIEGNELASSIASKIVNAVSIEGWTLSANANIVNIKCDTLGVKTISITFTDTDETGVTIDGISSPSVVGSNVIRKYSEDEWTTVTVDNLIEDGVYTAVDEDWIIHNATKYNTVTQDIDTLKQELGEDWVDVPISGERRIKGWITETGNWNNNSSYTTFIPIKQGYIIKLIGSKNVTNYIAVLQNIPTPVTFATGWSGRRALNARQVMNITVNNSTMKYLAVRSDTDAMIPIISITKKTYVKNRISTNEDNISKLQDYGKRGLSEDAFNINTATKYFGFPTIGNYYAGGDLDINHNSHFVIERTKAVMGFSIKGHASNGSYFLFAKTNEEKSSPSVGQYTFCEGTGRYFCDADETITFSSYDEGQYHFPDDCNYIIVGNRNTSKIYTPQEVIVYKSPAESVTELNDTVNDARVEVAYDYTRLFKLARFNGDAKAFGLMHFSDLHGDTEAAKELAAFIDKYSEYMDDSIDTGDRAYIYYNDAKPVVKARTLFTVGNHDGAANVSTVWRRGSADWDYKGREWDFDTYFAPYYDSTKTDTSKMIVDFPEGYDDPNSEYYKGCYWKKDYAASKVRLIGLNCMHFQDGTAYEGEARYPNDDQERWFAATLAETLDENNAVYGYKVIVAAHYGLDDFQGAYQYWDEQQHKWICNDIVNKLPATGGYVMNDMTGRAVAFHEENMMRGTDPIGKDWQYAPYASWRIRTGYGNNQQKTSVNRFGDILSDWIDNGGNFVVWISGHLHWNTMFYPKKYPNILNIVIEAGGTLRDGGSAQYRRDNGINARSSANMYFVKGNVLIIVRVGNTLTNSLEKRKYLAINYKTGKIIAYE